MEVLGTINLSSVSKQGRSVLSRTARDLSDPTRREGVRAAFFDNNCKRTNKRKHVTPS
jgi:hypothetical protein